MLKKNVFSFIYRPSEHVQKKVFYKFLRNIKGLDVISASYLLFQAFALYVYW